MFTNNYKPIEDAGPVAFSEEITVTTNKKNRRLFGRGEILAMITILLSFLGVTTYVINHQTSTSLSLDKMELVAVDGMNKVGVPEYPESHIWRPHELFRNILPRSGLKISFIVTRARNAGDTSIWVDLDIRSFDGYFDRNGRLVREEGQFGETYNRDAIGVVAFQNVRTREMGRGFVTVRVSVLMRPPANHPHCYGNVPCVTVYSVYEDKPSNRFIRDTFFVRVTR